MNVSFTTRLIDHQHQFFLARLIVSVLVSRTIRHTNLKLFERFAFRQLCTAALTWPISTWPKEAPSLSTTWSSTNRRPSTRCGTTWWTLSGQWAQTGSGPVGWSTETLRVLKGFLSLLMFDWFNETLEQKFKRTESSVGELTAAGAAGKCLQN